MGLFEFLFGPPSVEEMKARKDVEGLIKALGNEDWDVRQAAVEALGEIGDPRAVEPLIARLKDEDKDVRKAAAEALLKDKPVELLVVSLRDKDKNMRQTAAQRLSKMGWQPDDGADGAAYWIVKGKWDRIAQIGAPAVEPLCVALQDESEMVRNKAAKLLVQIGAPAVEPLIAALPNITAAKALGQIGDARAVEPLIATFKAMKQVGMPPNPWVSDTSGVEAFAAYVFKDIMRETVIRALDQIGDPRLQELLMDALNDRAPEVRKAAAIALGKRNIKDPVAVKSLIAALGDPVVDQRQGTAQALKRIGKPAVEPLISVLKDKREQVRESAAGALGQIGDSRAVEPLIAMLKDRKGDVRWAAAEALGKIGDARAVEPLIAMLKDRERDVRRAAAEALGKIGDARAVEPLIAALKDKDAHGDVQLFEALGQIGDARAVNPLIALLSRRGEVGSWWVRERAAEALVKIYRQKTLDEESKQLILAARPTITKRHHDESECYSHTDDGGIGVKFPL